jgi:hypothetical protein
VFADRFLLRRPIVLHLVLIFPFLFACLSYPVVGVLLFWIRF